MTSRKTIVATAVLVAMALVIAAAFGQGGHAQGSTHARVVPAAPSAPTASAASRYHPLPRHGDVGTPWPLVRDAHDHGPARAHLRQRLHALGRLDWDDMGGGYHMTARAYRSHGHWMAAHMQSWHGDWDDHGDIGPGMMG